MVKDWQVVSALRRKGTTIGAIVRLIRLTDFSIMSIEPIDRFFDYPIDSIMSIEPIMPLCRFFDYPAAERRTSGRDQRTQVEQPHQTGAPATIKRREAANNFSLHATTLRSMP
jgi:hypothetical protein